jgi:hypothetical protein
MLPHATRRLGESSRGLVMTAECNRNREVRVRTKFDSYAK